MPIKVLMSKVRKNKNIRSETKQVESMYNQVIATGESEIDIKSLQTTLDGLNKKYLWEIYSFLVKRHEQSKELITTNAQGSYFRWNGLSEPLKREFYDYVIMCQQSQKRLCEIKSAETEHRTIMKKLGDKLQSKPTSHQPRQFPSPSSENPDERSKYQMMKTLNENY